MRRSWRGPTPASFFVLILLFSIHATPSHAQQRPVIVHEGIDCLVTNQHAIVTATVQPQEGIRVVRFYFRSALYPEFYFIDMSLEQGQFRAILPKPQAETKRVVYYIEAVTHDFDTARSTNYEPQVVAAETDCEDDAILPLFFTGADPGIVIGVTQAGLPAIPPGFQAAGFAGAGISATTGVLIGAGGAGAATAIIVGGGGGEPAPPPAPPTTSVAVTTTSTPPPGSPLACFETEPDPPNIRVGESVNFDASCSQATQSQQSGLQTGWSQQTNDIVSYEWEFGDGRGGKEGRSVQRAYLTPGTFTATLTVTNQAGLQDSASRDVRVEEGPETTSTTSTSSTTSTTTTTTSIPNEADIVIGLGAIPNSPTATQMEIVLFVRNDGPMPASGVTAAVSFSSLVTAVDSFFSSIGVASCTLGVPTTSCALPPALGVSVVWQLTFTVTASPGSISINGSASSSSPPDPNGGNNSGSLGVTQSLRTTETPSTLDTSFVSVLEAPDPGGVRGQVNVNGARVDHTSSSSPFRHPVRGHHGENTVEARIVSGNLREGVWRFDFREASHFVRGSIQVVSGQVISQGASEVVFRLSGATGARIRFRYRLER